MFEEIVLLGNDDRFCTIQSGFYAVTLVVEDDVFSIHSDGMEVTDQSCEDFHGLSFSLACVKDSFDKGSLGGLLAPIINSNAKSRGIP